MSFHTTIPRIKVRPGHDPEQHQGGRNLLICVQHGSRDLIGKATLLDERTAGMTLGAIDAPSTEVLIAKLANYLFQTHILQRQSQRALGRHDQPDHKRELSNSFRFPVSPVGAERRAITTALSDVDALLDAGDRLVSKKRDLKQAATQHLVTGQTRLPGFRGEWEVKRLGKTGTFLKGSGVKKDEADSGNSPGLRYGEIYTHHNDHIRSFNFWISSRLRQWQPDCGRRFVVRRRVKRNRR